MAAKNNIRSMRFSDEILAMIEEQPGDTFTAKFEWLVMRCVKELPAREKELKYIKEQITRESRRLQDLSADVHKFRRIIDNLNMRANQLDSIIKESIRQLET